MEMAEEREILHLHVVHDAREEFAGLDNDALDFSQLEDFIANEADTNGSYFADTLANSEASKQAQGSSLRDRVIVVTNLASSDASIQYRAGDNKKGGCPVGSNQGCLPTTFTNSILPQHHNLPDSPPDSGSEPPYSPVDPGSRSPNHKNSSISGRRNNIHDLLLHPIYPSSANNGVSILLQPHDLTSAASLGSPITHIPPIHTSTLIPISPSPTSGPPCPSSNNGNVTLTTLGGGGSQVLDVSGSQPASSHHEIPFYTTLEPVTVQQSQPQPEPTTTTTKGRKRKSSGPGGGNSSAKSKSNMVNVKQEQAEMSPPESSSPAQGGASGGSNNDMNGGGSVDDEYYDLSNDPSMFMDPNYQCIKFQPFQDHTWNPLVDENLKELPLVYFKVDADKGFNFSNADDAFVCQKKNHFQITCHMKHQGNVKCVKTPEGYRPIDQFYVHFYGVKAESPNQCIKIEQFQSDRSKKPFHPVGVDINTETVSKITVGRLHFNETTSNNMRKNGKPNPDQRYFYLAVALHAYCPDGNYLLVAHSSQRIIVRASNPGQFESDMKLSWQKGQTADSIYHAGRVGINMDRPEEALVVYGNCKVTGQIIHPSDKRAKEDIEEVDSKEQLKNVQQLRVVRYKYNPQFARLIGLSDDDAVDTGVIAQEVQQIIPEAVKESGDISLPDGNQINNFLVVNKERIFMENIGAVKELCKVTGKLETRIDHLGKITKANANHTNGSSGDRERSNSQNISPKSSVRSSRSSSSSARRDSTRSTTEYICSNRFVQMLIVILVLFMAFSLVAMATLYMMEYHKRSSYDFHHHNPHVLYNTSHDFLNLAVPDYRHGGGSYGGAPSTYYPAPIHPHTYRQNHNPTKNPKFGIKAHPPIQSKSSEGLDTYSGQTKPKVLGRPKYCYPLFAYLDPNCGTFCCGSSIHSPVTDYSDIERRNLVALYSGSSGSGSTASTKKDNSETPVTLATINNSTTEDSISNFSSNPLHRNGLDTKRRRRRRRRQIDQDNPRLITVPSIRIVSQNINQSLDASYCMVNTNGYHDCVSTDNRYFSSANLTYHVPLSKYWDEMTLRLVFKFSSRINISEPQLCQEFHDQPYCRMDTADTGNTNGNKNSKPQTTTNTNTKPQIETDTNDLHQHHPLLLSVKKKNVFAMEVSVGDSPYSRFNIKFSSMVEDDKQDLCTLKQNIFEFNFHFYRVCHE